MDVKWRLKHLGCLNIYIYIYICMESNMAKQVKPVTPDPILQLNFAFKWLSTIIIFKPLTF